MNSNSNAEKVELSIGISGHRWVTESHELLDAIDQVMDAITQRYSYERLKVLSPLAEGADRIIAKRLLSLPKVQLVALLPFPMMEYMKDFSTPESEREFKVLYNRAERIIELPGSHLRDEAYVALGKILIEQSEILIALWDGKPAKGRGGTAEIVFEARQKGVPLAWIELQKLSSKEEHPSYEDDDQVRIVFERFPAQKSITEPEN